MSSSRSGFGEAGSGGGSFVVRGQGPVEGGAADAEAPGDGEVGFGPDSQTRPGPRAVGMWVAGPDLSSGILL